MKNNRAFSYDNKISQRNSNSKINVPKVSEYLLISIICTYFILSIFPINAVCTDLICQKNNKKSKELINEDGSVIWMNPHVSHYKSIPAPEAFIPCTKDPGINMQELQQKLIYPDSARRANIEGKVILRVLVDNNGDILKVICESSNSTLLTQAALDAIKKTKFTPAYQDEIPIICWISIPFNFKLK